MPAVIWQWSSVYKKFNEKYTSQIPQLTFFLGAGASVAIPSCLPTANTLKKDILKKLCDLASIGFDDKFIKLFEAFPLEFLLQIIKEVAGLKTVVRFLEPLGTGNNNLIHYTISQLCKSGLCNTIITVNFDNLMEKMLAEEGCSYNMYFNSLKLKERSNKIRVYKIHGSIDKPKSLQATLEHVGKPLSSRKKIELMELLRQNEVVFIGYRGSDYDIKPVVLQYISENNNYLWNSLSSQEIDNDLLKFLDFSKLRTMKGEVFINELINKYKINISFVDKKNNKLVINSDVKLISIVKARKIIYRIFGHLGYWSDLEENSKNLEKKLTFGDKIGYYYLLYNTSIRNGDWKKAERYLFDIRNFINNKSFLSCRQRVKWLFTYGKFLIGKGDKRGYIIFHKLIYYLLIPLSNNTGIAKYVVNILWKMRNSSLDWHRVVLLTLLVENYPEGLRPDDDPYEYIALAYKFAGNHVQLRAVVKRTEAALNGKLSQYDKAEMLFLDALKEIELTADYNGKFVLLIELSKLYVDMGILDKARRYIERAEEGISRNENNEIRKAEIFEQKAIICNYDNRDKQEIIKYKSIAIELYCKMGLTKRVDNLNKRLNF